MNSIVALPPAGTTYLPPHQGPKAVNKEKRRYFVVSGLLAWKRGLCINHIHTTAYQIGLQYFSQDFCCCAVNLYCWPNNIIPKQLTEDMTEFFVNYLSKKFYNFGHNSGHEKNFGKSFCHTLKHGTNLVWLAFHDPANHTSSVILWNESTKVAFTRHCFQHKNKHTTTIFAFHLYANDENGYSKRRLLNLET